MVELVTRELTDEVAEDVATAFFGFLLENDPPDWADVSLHKQRTAGGQIVRLTLWSQDAVESFCTGAPLSPVIWSFPSN